MLITKSRKNFAIFLILISLIAVIAAACGPAGGGEDGVGLAETAVESEPNTEAKAEAETGEDSLEVEPNSLETDSKGLTVGFTKDGHAFRGDPDAPVVIEEYSDFQCPYCARFFSQTLPALEDNQLANGEAVLVYYDFPLNTIHPQANLAANAARCAGDQGAAAYWDMHDRLFATMNNWSNSQANSYFIGIADEMGLDSDAFSACLEETPHQEAIQEDLNAGSSYGITGTPSFRVNGQLMVGAQPLTVFENAIAAAGQGQPIAGASGSGSGQQQPQEPAAAPTPAVFSDDFAATMGDPNAPVTIVEFTDYQCPYCSQHSAQTMPQVIQNMVETGRVYYILKDFPLDQIHPDARIGAAAARCAGDQDAYWEMHDLLFARQSNWSGSGEEAAVPVLMEFAAELELDTQEFGACLESGRYNDAVESNLQEGRALGVNGTPHFFIDGYPLNGARPYEHFDLAVGMAEEGRLAEAFEQPAQPDPQPQPQQPQQELPLTVVEGDAHSLGDPNAPITIVEFTDYQCPYCSRHFQETYPQIIDEYINEGIVRYVFKDFPLNSIHPQAAKAAEAARCAGDQNAYLEMHDMLFNRQSEWGVSNPVPVFSAYASELDLNTEEFTECLESSKYEAAVNADLQQGIELGVTGTPAFFMNGYPLSGAQPFNVFQQGVNTLLSQEGTEEQ